MLNFSTTHSNMQVPAHGTHQRRRRRAFCLARVLRVDTRARYTRVRRGAMYQALIHAPATLGSMTGRQTCFDGSVIGWDSRTHNEGGTREEDNAGTAGNEDPAHTPPE